MIKAKDFNNYIEDKTNQTLYQLKGYTGLYTLKQACFEFALLLNAFRKKNKGIIKENQLARKLATRLEREFLRSEKEAITLDDNEAILDIAIIDSELIIIEQIEAKALLYSMIGSIEEDLVKWCKYQQLTDKKGFYKIKACIDEIDNELYSSYYWYFELIDFKSEVSND